MVCEFKLVSLKIAEKIENKNNNEKIKDKKQQQPILIDKVIYVIGVVLLH